MLFSKAILQAAFAANAPLREVLAIERARLRALRAKRTRIKEPKLRLCIINLVEEITPRQI